MVADQLTGRGFDAIRLNGPGTDLTVGLLPSSRWEAGAHTRADGLSYMANIPTEEMFTSPDPVRVDGHVTSTRPLEVYGVRIDGIRVQFEGGRATRLDADTGADALRGIAATDEGACRLGELALVDGEGRIGPLGRTFHMTLLDENSASHIALGSAYASAIGTDADKARANKSKIHVDFMIGSPELDVDGLTESGEHGAAAPRRCLADLAGRHTIHRTTHAGREGQAPPLRSAGLGDGQQPLLDRLRLTAEVVEARECSERLQPEDALEE